MRCKRERQKEKSKKKKWWPMATHMHAKRYGLLNNMWKDGKWHKDIQTMAKSEIILNLEWFWNGSIRPFSIFRIIQIVYFFFFVSSLYSQSFCCCSLSPNAIFTSIQHLLISQYTYVKIFKKKRKKKREIYRMKNREKKKSEKTKQKCFYMMLHQQRHRARDILCSAIISFMK